MASSARSFESNHVSSVFVTWVFPCFCNNSVLVFSLLICLGYGLISAKLVHTCTGAETTSGTLLQPQFTCLLDDGGGGGGDAFCNG